MKTFLTIVAMWACFFIYSCNGDEPQGYGDEQFCNCGTVCDDGIDSAHGCYWLIVENECSGATKTFCVDQLIWSAYKEGDRICINDQKPW